MDVAATSVLIVCKANICRSPMAEVLWRANAAQRPRPIGVTSAGLDAQPGFPADPVCVELLEARGFTGLAAHRSTRLRLASAGRHELILAMEPPQVQRIKAAAPTLAGRVYLLGHWLTGRGQAGTIADPHGGPHEAYEQCLGQIEQSIELWLRRL
jgi:protein-tyrosine phosphatase